MEMFFNVTLTMVKRLTSPVKEHILRLSGFPKMNSL